MFMETAVIRLEFVYSLALAPLILVSLVWAVWSLIRDLVSRDPTLDRIEEERAMMRACSWPTDGAHFEDGTIEIAAEQEPDILDDELVIAPGAIEQFCWMENSESRKSVRESQE